MVDPFNMITSEARNVVFSKKIFLRYSAGGIRIPHLIQEWVSFNERLTIGRQMAFTEVDTKMTDNYSNI